MKKKISLLLFLLHLSVLPVFSADIGENRLRSVDLYILLSRLDLDRPELGAVKTSYGNPAIVARELLKYYKSRTSPGYAAGLRGKDEDRAAVDEEYAREWCSQFIDRTKKNPGGGDDHKNAWRSVETGIRACSRTALFQYFIDSPHFNAEVLVAFLNSMYDYAAYLMTEDGNNSGRTLMEAEGLACTAIFFPEFRESEIWREEAFRIMSVQN